MNDTDKKQNKKKKTHFLFSIIPGLYIHKYKKDIMELTKTNWTQLNGEYELELEFLKNYFWLVLRFY